MRVLLVFVLVLLAGTAAAQSLTLVGPAGRSETLSAKDMTELPREEVVLAGKTYEGPTLTGLLRLAGTPSGPTLHMGPVRDYVVVTGADGFSAVLSLAETDVWLHKGVVILADSVGGAALSAHDGPWRLMVDGDVRPSRSVRNVVKVEVRQAAP